MINEFTGIYTTLADDVIPGKDEMKGEHILRKLEMGLDKELRKQ